jgi:hypothetical protein
MSNAQYNVRRFSTGLQHDDKLADPVGFRRDAPRYFGNRS